jgi:hypothetical protein
LAGNTLIETLPKILISRILIELISQEWTIIQCCFRSKGNQGHTRILLNLMHHPQGKI